ncbi:energy transducer TonB family protein [Mangrovimicrobium sediminis]|nr:energy transducer TonB [Haliea sp. SAOS-164]
MTITATARPLRPLYRLFLLVLGALLPLAQAQAQFTPPQNLDPASGVIRLGSSYQSDAWLVYTYDIDASGVPADVVIQSSNGVLEVEQAVLEQVNAMRFKPAMRGGQPVRVSADPVVFTWILDKPREMSPRFDELYRQAWDFYAQEDYDAAFDIAVQLKNYPGRNALEEVKFQILAASLASRWKDEAAEMQHLSRVVELQSLALDNNFRNTYVPDDQYLKILNRILELQLARMMLADAGNTLDDMQTLGRGTPIVQEASAHYQQVEQAFHARDDVVVAGELVPLYRDGPGSWKSGLSRAQFSISDVRGQISSVFLVCAEYERSLRYPAREPWQIPAGWTQCKIDVAGKAGTRFRLHQHAPSN